VRPPGAPPKGGGGGGGCYEIPGCISHFVSVIFCMYRVAILTLQDHEWVDFQIYFRFEHRNVLSLTSSMTNSSYTEYFLD